MVAYEERIPRPDTVAADLGFLRVSTALGFEYLSGVRSNRAGLWAPRKRRVYKACEVLGGMSGWLPD